MFWIVSNFINKIKLKKLNILFDWVLIIIYKVVNNFRSIFKGYSAHFRLELFREDP